jgi:pimeloyl-ACP methyl ester carboxylesterase
MMLLLLPGMDGTGLLFEPFVRSLPLGNKPVIVKYPCGEFMGYEDLAARAAAAIPDKPYMILAESYSGPVGALVAARHIGDLRALVFVNGFVHIPLRPLAASISGCICSLALLSWSIGRACRWILTNGCRDPHICSALKMAISQVPVRLLRARVRAALNADFSGSLGKCTVPVFYISATDDRVVGGRGLRSVLDSRPETQVANIPGPHLLLQCAPAECVEALRQFGLF